MSAVRVRLGELSILLTGFATHFGCQGSSAKIFNLFLLKLTLLLHWRFQMPKKFTDAQLDELLAKGYLIVPDYYSGEQLAEMQAAQRRVLPTWEEVQRGSTSGQSDFDRISAR